MRALGKQGSTINAMAHAMAHNLVSADSMSHSAGPVGRPPAGLRYTHMAIGKFCCIILLSTHWLACAWRLQIQFEEDQSSTWMHSTRFFDESNLATFVYCYYWACIQMVACIRYSRAQPQAV